VPDAFPCVLLVCRLAREFEETGLVGHGSQVICPTTDLIVDHGQASLAPCPAVRPGMEMEMEMAQTATAPDRNR
jgi:hypothetical protein